MDGAVGCAFPAVVKRGVTLSAANVDASWIGLDADALFTERLGREVHMINDADAAGIAEVRSASPATAPASCCSSPSAPASAPPSSSTASSCPTPSSATSSCDGHDAEDYASERARIDADISWKKYAARLDEFLAAMEALVNPDLIVLGGGGSKKADRFLPLLDRTCEVVPAADAATRPASSAPP